MTTPQRGAVPKQHASVLGPMLAGEVPWPKGVPKLIAPYGAVGDISDHHNDIRGELGLEAERDGIAREISYEAQTFLLQSRGTAQADQICEFFGDVDAGPYLPIISSNALPGRPLEV